MKTKYSNEEIHQIIIDESFIQTIKWTNNASDLQIILDWCGQPDIAFSVVNAVFLHFEFVWDVKMEWQYGEQQVGMPEISHFYFEKTDNFYFISLIFDFHPKGFIQLKCNNLHFCFQ